MEKITANTEIKQKNRANIYQLFRQYNELSRQDVVSKLQISLPTVNQNLQNLQNEGLICESGSIGNTGGRKAKAYSLVKDARTAIGIDLTKNHITVVAVDLTGSIIAKKRIVKPFERTDEYYKLLGETVEQIIRDAGIDRSKVLGAGIGIPGLVTPDKDTVYYGGVLNCTGATKNEFSKYIKLSTRLYHDVDASGFAEMWYNPDIKNAFYIMLSNSIGGTIYINNNQYFGENLRGGEVGHLIIEPGGKKCYCGRRGCFDAYCSATVLSSLTGGNLAVFFSLLKSGNEEACERWDVYLHHLANTVFDLRMLFDCPIIIGGYIGEYIDEYLDDLKSIIAKDNKAFDNNLDYILPCKFKMHATAVGAALYYISDFLRQI